MTKCILFQLLSLAAFVMLDVRFLHGQADAFIVMGDLHFDKFEHHDLDYVRTRPQDYKQIMNEYPQYTAFFVPHFLRVIKEQAEKPAHGVKAVAQLGDLVQGVSGNAELARKMNRDAVDMMHGLHLAVPWVLVKGNHDVSNSPGQPEAWSEVIRPFMEGQVKKAVDNGMYSYSLSEDTELFVADQFFSKDQGRPEEALLAFLEHELSRSKAKFKFLLTHQPVIPVTVRCWHLFSGARRPVTGPHVRQRFLDLLAKHNVIVLTAHLHEYAIVSRRTDYGNIVQVMINSVNRDMAPPQPQNATSEYKGAGWVDENPHWEPRTAGHRRLLLGEEQKQINSFYRADLPGYGIIHIANEVVTWKFFNGMSLEPFEVVNLTELQNHSK
ncbi:metallophosphoesterase family protein [Parapedobacter sp. GCM10030251]|uniref:metallophosphoesterase family protein n=1 Tax=Parapedobacter sp. GCM10030251 TaxID=3273419 RepID=UPI0036186A9B